MTTIETKQSCRFRVRSDGSGFIVTDTDRGQGIAVVLSDAERRALVAALAPERDGQWPGRIGNRADGSWLLSSGLRYDLAEWLNDHHPKPQAYDQGGVCGADSLLYRAERERDAAVARAEQAEQLIPAYAMLDVWVALGRDSLHFDDWYDGHGYADAWAELTAAVREGRPAPEVTRDDIQNAIRTAFNQRGGGYTIWHVEVPTAGVCELLGIEAEAVVDPVEAKARELCRAAYPDHEWGEADWDVADHWNGIEDAFRRLARHQLGQEADR